MPNMRKSVVSLPRKGTCFATFLIHVPQKKLARPRNDVLKNFERGICYFTKSDRTRASVMKRYGAYFKTNFVSSLLF